ncbi:hypothetical protein AA980_12230 [Neobacillus vireti]|nr:hypothetical protein AA980_12230 [Neobacillus vireti]
MIFLASMLQPKVPLRNLVPIFGISPGLQGIVLHGWKICLCLLGMQRILRINPMDYSCQTPEDTLKSIISFWVTFYPLTRRIIVIRQKLKAGWGMEQALLLYVL